MADYLLPNEEIECIDEQRKIFAIRNRMVEIPANFSKDIRIKSINTCACGTIETMEHIYMCVNWNKKSNHEKIPYETIFSNNVSKQLKVSQQFFYNLEQREKHNVKNRIVTNEILLCDPPSSVKSVAMDCK